jgi:hypothetical protein
MYVASPCELLLTFGIFCVRVCDMEAKRKPEIPVFLELPVMASAHTHVLSHNGIAWVGGWGSTLLRHCNSTTGPVIFGASLLTSATRLH